MNKSLVTNSIALIVWVTGLLIPESSIKPFILSIGLFALAGAITNWLAIHMLFEKIPGLYGSGVIQERFEEFKSGILKLVMENFFTEENFKNFANTALHESSTAASIQSQIDLNSLFNGFLGVVENSKFGGMLSMFGGTKALEPLREPFKNEFKNRISEVLEQIDLTKGDSHYEDFYPTVEKLVKGKLDQLEPKQVKQIVEKMIKEHLGWLVIWGGVCGGAIGFFSALAS
ncbi:DUF445 domain-containing protein [Puniceicoccaceae bacterium K14]|nr:DUF445 domain-containing protein [Puniceicoccaceae bacterium K14]